MLKTGDVAWRCETCQTDPQAILCQACYENSDHTGHKIWLKTNVGGCCDCGNPDAFKKEGWCTRHQGFESSNEAFIASLSPYLKVSSPQTFSAVLSQFKRVLLILQAEPGNLNVQKVIRKFLDFLSE